jgi:hypothetical protein
VHWAAVTTAAGSTPATLTLTAHHFECVAAQWKEETMNTIINVADVAARTKLAVLQTGAWRATRINRNETRNTNATHGTGNAAKVLVRVTDHVALTGLAKLHAHTYQVHRKYTLPTVQDGMRLLPAGREFEHAAEMQKLADQHNAFVREFLADYETERLNAPSRLNGLFDASMWPSLHVVESKFTFQTRYLATPVDGEWGEWLTASVESAEAELRDRIEEALKRVKDRCKSDGKLYASVFDAIRELATLAPDLDFGGDYAPVVQAMAPLTKIHAEDVRDNPAARRKVAKQADNILSVLGGIK